MPTIYRYFIPLCLLLLTLPTYAAVNSAATQAKNKLADNAISLKPSDSQFSPEQHKRLDILFTRLASSDNESAARQLIAEIWSIWKQPVDKQLQEKMYQAEQLFVSGNKAESFTILDAAIEAYPGYSEIWNQRATYYYYAGRYEDSLSDIAKVLELEPRHFGALSGKIAILMRESRMEAAIKTLYQALKINPFMPEARLLLPKDKQPAKKSPGVAI